jgi:hypothetical protein
MVQSDDNEIKIKEEPSVPPEIFEAASSGKLVLFIGAGVSRIIGCPSWENLALQQLKDLYEKNVINYHEYINLKLLDTRKLLSICRNVCKKNNIEPPSMKSLLKGKEESIKKFKIYEDIYALNAIYITTNYDSYLDEIIQKPIHKNEVELNLKVESKFHVDEEKPKGKIIYQKEDMLISNLLNGYVIHFHGSVNDEKNVVMTIVDYMKYYKYDSEPAVLLEEIFEKYIVLFIGYGLEEYEIIEFLISKSYTEKTELRHFMLYPMFGKNNNLLKFYQEYYGDLSIQLLPYSIDKNGYDQLAIVISKWAKQIGPISRPQGFLERIRSIDEVI